MSQNHAQALEHNSQRPSSKPISNERLQPSIYLESTVNEQLGLLPGEARLVKDVMSSALTVASPQTSLREAADLMKNLGVPVIVVYDGARLVGLLSDRDLALSQSPDGPAEDRTIGSVMQTNVPACLETHRLGEALSLLQTAPVDWLPVLDLHDHVVGVLSRYAAP